jgi:Invasin, domain 3
MNCRGICFALLALPLLLPLAGCDKATPVAPDGTVLTISANPSRIGLNGTSVITVVGRKPDGNPLNPGTEIRFSTDRGTVDPPVAQVQDGAATAVLRADGRSGAAMVTAATGGGDTSAQTQVQIGETDDTRPTLSVNANPNDIPVGGTSTITVIARNADGSSVPAGLEVILTSTLGTINPARPTTRSDGTATATLRAGTVAGTATVTAIVGSSQPQTTTITIRDAATDISVTASPGVVSPQGGTITLSALVVNGQGLGLAGAPVTFEAEVGELSATLVSTGSNGLATATLELLDTDLDTAGASVTVTVRTPAGNGQFLSRSIDIPVR